VEFEREQWPDVTAALDRQNWDALIPHLLRAGAEVATVSPALRRYGELLLQWNRLASNLISKNDEPRMVARHFGESLEPAHWLKSDNATRWVDFGSGGGFPALPLAIAGVGDEWTLIESRRTKCLFLRRCAEQLALRGVRVEQARLEDVVASGNLAGQFDAFTSRATLAAVPTLALAATLVVPGGHAFLWKGSRREEELAADDSWKDQWELDGLLGIGDGQTVVERFVRRGAR
jgi:16S rRNA (guanine527-N7)-methyltransferase